MQTPNSATPNPVVSVRVSVKERGLLETAAAQAHTNLSDFIRRKALEAAELDILDHRIITIPAKDWDRFEEWTRSPAKTIPALRDLAAFRPTWEK